MTMTSIKIKFRPSTVDGKEGGIYFQIIHSRVVRQMNTEYKVFAEEWNAESESIVIKESRSNFLLGIQERLSWDVARLEKVVRTLEIERRRFTADDVISMFHKQTKESSFFNFMHGVIAQLKQLGKSVRLRPISPRSKASWYSGRIKMYHLTASVLTSCFFTKPT